MIKVYHANPDVVGYIRSGITDASYVSVKFDVPVGFSGNPDRFLNRDWNCHIDLLYNTSEEARRNSREYYKEKENNKPTKRKLILD